MSATAPGLDDKGFGDALVQLAEPLRRRAYRLTRDACEADNLVQETLVKAWAARIRFQPGTSLRAWPYTILQNVFLTRLRRSRRMVALDELTVERLATDGAQHQTAELGEALEALERLPADEGAALQAVTLEGLDYKAAANKLNVTEAALKSRVRRARAALTRLFEQGLPKPLLRPTPRKPAPVIAEPSRFRGVWAAKKASNETLWIG